MSLSRYFGYLYSNWLSSEPKQLVDQSKNCEDILLNFLISHVTKSPPIKLTQHKHLQEVPLSGATVAGYKNKWLNTEHFTVRHHCINVFVQEFGYMPLVRSNMRFDPLLFKDKVSRTRKKYRQIDSLT